MKSILSFLLTIVYVLSYAQENLPYQKPSKEILDLVDVQMTPRVLIDDAYNFMVLTYRDRYKSIEDLSKQEMRLAGLRIDPKTNIGSRITYYNNIKIKEIKNKNAVELQVSGLPENPRLTNFKWSPDQKMMAMTNTSSEGVSVWIVDIESAKASKISDDKINANLGSALHWFKDGKSLLVKMVPENRKALINTKNALPFGPTVSKSDGKKAQNRTYQDLLKNKNDEHNFEQLALSEIYRIDLNGNALKWLSSDMYGSIDISPDGNFVLVNTIKKPFSYLVTYRRFPSSTTVYTKDANKTETIAEVPLTEDLPKGFMATRTGRRNIQWRNDKPSTIVFAEALDKGDPAVSAEFRDEIFQLQHPFKGKATSILKTKNRIRRLLWGNNNIAIAQDYWWDNRNEKTYLFDPSDNTKEVITLFDRNSQDVYNDPGSFVMEKNKFAENVIAIKGDKAFLSGDGFSPEGQFPYLKEINLKTNKSKTIYRSEYKDKLEEIREYDPEKNIALVRIESPAEYPNYYLRHLKKNKLSQLTYFENPFSAIQNIDKKLITYKRKDGVDLSGTLYLPADYDMENKEKLPLIIWAYPREYKDKRSAGQNTNNPNEFTSPSYGSMIYWVTKGYAVLDDAAFPIVGEGDEEPNDSFRSQLVDNAEAAINAVDKMGYIDRNRVAVGGHSYGAFMVANLLSHSDLFAAGIARSGAYNRTLTPFGFQSEQRSYWEAPEVYYSMSPFMHADKMKTPLLLIHGEADNNSGTYPMQSERYFNALKGLGAPVRLVILPKESHGYRAKESILHLLWEQDQWLEKHVKNKTSDKPNL